MMTTPSAMQSIFMLLYPLFIDFFPNNDTGYTIAKTIQNRNSKHVHDCSLLYAANETLHDFAHAYLEEVNK